MRYRERQALIAEALLAEPGMELLDDDALRQKLAVLVGERWARTALSLESKQALTQELFDTMRGLDILEKLLRDPSISEIMVNGSEHIFIEKEGRLQPCSLHFDDEEHLMRVIQRCFGRANRLLSEQKPIGSLRFADGSRLQAMLPPASPDGPALSIRRFNNFTPELSELVRRDSLSEEVAAFLKRAVQMKKNIFVSGGTGSGKTSFLNALSTAIPASERVITIEDTAELRLRGLPNLLRLEAREAGPDGKGAIVLEDLIRAALRLRPDRIIVGEVRGEEAYAMIEAMRSGHPGSMSSGHANSPEDMLERLAMLLLLRMRVPWEAILRMLTGALDLIVHLERLPSGRRQLREIVHPSLDSSGKAVCRRLFIRNGKGVLQRVPWGRP